MKHATLLACFGALLVGCNTRPEPRYQPARATPAPAPEELAALPLEQATPEIVLSLDPELAEVVATISDPMIDRIDAQRMRVWRERAELRMAIEVLLGQRDYLRRLEQLAEEAEERFLLRADGSPATSDELRVFGLIRERIQRRIAANARELAGAQEQLRALLAP